MKRFKNILPLILLLCCTILNAQEEPFHDSIHVQINDKTELELAVNNYKDLGGNIETDFTNLKSILKESDEIPKGVSYIINYDPNTLVSIKQSGQNEKIIWKDNELSHYQLNNKCIINSDKYHLLIRFNDIESLLSDNLIVKIKEAINTTDTIQGRFAATYNYSFQGDKLVHNKQFDKITGQIDALELKGGVGINIIKNQPVIDLSAETGFIFSKKGIWKNWYYLSFNQLSDFDKNSTINFNCFVNIGYRNNLSGSVKNPNWLGLEIGYLAIRHSDLFEKNTFRFGVNWEIGKYITISPQLYLSRHSSYPAVRIGFGL